MSKTCNLHPCNGKTGYKTLHVLATDFEGRSPSKPARSAFGIAFSKEWLNIGVQPATLAVSSCKFQPGACNPTCFVGVPGLKNIESGQSSLDTPGFHQIWPTLDVLAVKNQRWEFQVWQSPSDNGPRKDCLYLREVPLWFASLALWPHAGALRSSEQWWSTRSHSRCVHPNIANSCNSDLWNKPLDHKGHVHLQGEHQSHS